MFNVTGYDPVNSSGRLFLAWQTWDLLRITWYGFKNLCIDFTARYPGVYMAPLRLNGSVIETLFSQLKYISHGDLSATRYPPVAVPGFTEGGFRTVMCARRAREKF